MNQRKTFEELNELINKISKHKDNIKYLGILGNKINLSENDCISKEEIEEFAKNHKGYLPIDINDIRNLKESIKNTMKKMKNNNMVFFIIRINYII